MKISVKPTGQTGFTIVELMIATVVLSVIILLTTVVITSIGNLYYKGVNQSRTQDNVRAIADDITQHLEYSNATINGTSKPYGSTTVYSYCIGTTRYSYALSMQIGVTIPHALWRDIDKGGSCTPVDITQSTPPDPDNPPPAKSDGTELLAPNSSLTYFNVSNTSPYTVQIATAFGDPSLMNNYLLPTNPQDTTCKGTAGEQFCATAYLTTTVVQRVTGS